MTKNRRFDYTIQRNGCMAATEHDAGPTAMIAHMARVLDAVVMSNDPDEAKVSITIRPAKETKYEVWCSMDAGEVHETTFSSLENAKKHADDLWEQERARYEKAEKTFHQVQLGDLRHYYVKQRRGRGKGVVVYKAYPK